MCNSCQCSCLSSQAHALLSDRSSSPPGLQTAPAKPLGVIHTLLSAALLYHVEVHVAPGGSISSV